LILDFARLVGELKPRYFVVENVRGLLFKYSKPTLDKFLQRVDEVGYEILNPIQLLDASHFGVPQKRRRAFILGHLRGMRPPQIPHPASNNNQLLPAPTVEEAIGDLPNVSRHDQLLKSDLFSGTLGAPSAYARSLRESKKSCNSSDAEGLSGCLRTVHSQKTQMRFLLTTPGTYEPISRCYRLKSDGISFTLRAGSDVNNGSFTAARPIHPTQPRCITTREAARLHSFPDWFQFHPTKWHGFRQVGNAVPPLLAQAVAREVYEVLKMKSAAKRKGRRLMQSV
jgi:DNA (cytosine-5)-methyltransferase 1